MEGEEALCTLGSSSTLPPGAFLRADDSASLPQILMPQGLALQTSDFNRIATSLGLGFTTSQQQ